jgi:primosomal protein N' (replication factor Y)
VGKRVLVPFGRKRLTGWIVETLTETTPDQTVKEIIDLPDPEPFFDRQDLACYEWISRYYIHPLGKVLGEILPGGIDVKSDRWLRLADSPAIGEPSLSAGQKEILERLASFPKGLSLGRLRRMMGKNNLYGDLHLLETSGLVISEERLNRPAVRPKWEKWIGLRADIPAGIKLTAKQAALVALLQERGDAPGSPTASGRPNFSEPWSKKASSASVKKSSSGGRLQPRRSDGMETASPRTRRRKRPLLKSGPVLSRGAFPPASSMA